MYYTRFLLPVSEAKAIFDANTVGPRAYVKMYDKYADILTGQSLNQKEEFLKSEATLDQFRVPFLCSLKTDQKFKRIILEQSNKPILGTDDKVRGPS